MIDEEDRLPISEPEQGIGEQIKRKSLLTRQNCCRRATSPYRHSCFIYKSFLNTRPISL
jgi:hypothetical protein